MRSTYKYSLQCLKKTAPELTHFTVILQKTSKQIRHVDNDVNNDG